VGPIIRQRISWYVLSGYCWALLTFTPGATHSHTRATIEIRFIRFMQHLKEKTKSLAVHICRRIPPAICIGTGFGKSSAAAL
jgi:hypothetical protein